MRNVKKCYFLQNKIAIKDKIELENYDALNLNLNAGTSAFDIDDLLIFFIIFFSPKFGKYNISLLR